MFKNPYYKFHSISIIIAMIIEIVIIKGYLGTLSSHNIDIFNVSSYKLDFMVAAGVFAMFFTFIVILMFHDSIKKIRKYKKAIKLGTRHRVRALKISNKTHFGNVNKKYDNKKRTYTSINVVCKDLESGNIINAYLEFQTFISYFKKDCTFDIYVLNDNVIIDYESFEYSSNEKIDIELGRL